MKTKYLFLFLIVLFIVILPASGQKMNKKRFLTGYVTDKNGNPVAGAMVLIDKMNTNVITDNKGFYKVKIKPDAGLLTIFTLTSGNGEASIEGRTLINITLSGVQTNPVDNTRENGSVNIGYGSVDRKDLTTQVNKIDGVSSKYASYTNIYDMLNGAVPGVTVVGKSITIQGVSSINLSTEPLLVVNGMVVTSIDDISPIEVKSIEVLKGPAAAIYGSRGANGVILITLEGSSDTK
ncbi:MAG: TonB-dependent receptor plug domain-containing protein [Bacteroidales bacterium]